MMYAVSKGVYYVQVCSWEKRSSRSNLLACILRRAFYSSSHITRLTLVCFSFTFLYQIKTWQVLEANMCCCSHSSEPVFFFLPQTGASFTYSEPNPLRLVQLLSVFLAKLGVQFGNVYVNVYCHQIWSASTRHSWFSFTVLLISHLSVLCMGRVISTLCSHLEGRGIACQTSTATLV